METFSRPVLRIVREAFMSLETFTQIVSHYITDIQRDRRCISSGHINQVSASDLKPSNAVLRLETVTVANEMLLVDSMSIFN
jgi:hypothetical protein